VPAVLQQPSILRAVEELKMLTQTDIERERYEARRKAQLDYNSGMNYARTQGERIGAIHMCERMLQRPETPKEQLIALSLEDLTRLTEDLEKQALRQE
jgi:hypothetical protein